MAKEVTVTFKLTETKTTVIFYDTTGAKEIDITGGTIEDKFRDLVRMIHEVELVKEATDLSTWEQVS